MNRVSGVGASVKLHVGDSQRRKWTGETVLTFLPPTARENMAQVRKREEKKTDAEQTGARESGSVLTDLSMLVPL